MPETAIASLTPVIISLSGMGLFTVCFVFIVPLVTSLNTEVNGKIPPSQMVVFPGFIIGGTGTGFTTIVAIPFLSALIAVQLASVRVSIV